MAIAIERLKGHDNSTEGFETIKYIEVPSWLAYKLTGVRKGIRYDNCFPVIGETEKAYKILCCKDTSMSFNFCRPTWFIDYVAKSVVINVIDDVEAYEKEVEDFYTKKYQQ